MVEAGKLGALLMANEIQIILPSKLQQDQLQLLTLIDTVQIRDNQTYQDAGRLLQNIGRARKQIEDFADPIIKANWNAYKVAMEQKKNALMPLELGQKKIDALMLKWKADREAIRRKQEEELAALKKQQAEEQALKEAQQYANEGDTELAEEVLKQAIAAPAPVVALPQPTPKVEGFSTRTHWRWKIENPDLIPREYLRPDEVKIGGVVRALKGATKIPGVKVYPEEGAIHR